MNRTKAKYCKIYASVKEAKMSLFKATYPYSLKLYFL